MGHDIQFAFLGCHNSYLASVAWVTPNTSNRAHEYLHKEYHGLPKKWVDKYVALMDTTYISNVCGNDCFAWLGHRTSRNTEVYTEKSEYMILEIESLRCFAAKADFKAAEPLLLTLGPSPGSFFAESRSLKRYRWASLPSDLDDKIQEEVCRNRYGTIWDVAINASEGWVMQFDEGKSYNWGGKLPQQLANALWNGQNNKKQIKKLCLNHQNKDDYVLIFTDGTAFIGLHRDFQKQIEKVITAAFTEKRRLFFSERVEVKIHFEPTCSCDSQTQDQRNAAYYNQRGRLHLRRKSPKHALTYMREAYRLDVANSIYKDDYFMARVASDQLDEDFEEHLSKRQACKDEDIFQDERNSRVEQLRKRHKILCGTPEPGILPEWSYSEGPPQPIFVEGPDELSTDRGIHELESREVENARHDSGKQTVLIYR